MRHPSMPIQIPRLQSYEVTLTYTHMYSSGATGIIRHGIIQLGLPERPETNPMRYLLTFPRLEPIGASFPVRKNFSRQLRTGPLALMARLNQKI